MATGGNAVWDGTEDDDEVQALVCALPLLLVGVLCAVGGIAHLSWQILVVGRQEQKKYEDPEHITRFASSIQSGCAHLASDVIFRLSAFCCVIAVLLAALFCLHPLSSTSKEPWSDGIRVAFLFSVGALTTAVTPALTTAFVASGGAKTAVACTGGGAADRGSLAFQEAAAAGITASGLVSFVLSGAFLLVAKPRRDLDQAVQLLQAFGAGASCGTVIVRVAVGIFAKAASIAADFLVKAEAGLAENEVMNPLALANRVGDMACGAAGNSTGHLETFICSLLVAMKLGEAHSVAHLALPLWLAVASMVANLISVLAVLFLQSLVAETFPSIPLLTAPHLLAFYVAIVVYLCCAALSCCLLFGSDTAECWKLFSCVVVGLASSWFVGKSVEYFAQENQGPAESCKDRGKVGAAPVIVQGFGIGMASTAPAAILLTATVLVASALAGAFGIALAAVASISALAVLIACDVFGSITDTAGGLVRLACPRAPDVLVRAHRLARLGTSSMTACRCSTAASSTLVGVSLLVAFLHEVTKTEGIAFEVSEPMLLVGALLGAMSPYFFGALTLLSVGSAVVALLNEARWQLTNIRSPRGVALQDLIRRSAKDPEAAVVEVLEPNGDRCVKMLVQRASSAAMPPAAFGLLLPLLVALLAGARVLAGFLFGMLGVAPMLALTFRSAGGVWFSAVNLCTSGDPAFIRPEQVKACATARTIGEALGGTVGPTLDSLLKFTGTSALVIAPVLNGRNDWQDWPWGIVCAIVSVGISFSFVGFGLTSWKDGHDGEPDEAQTVAAASKAAAAAVEVDASKVAAPVSAASKVATSSADDARDSEAAPMIGKKTSRREPVCTECIAAAATCMASMQRQGKALARVLLRCFCSRIVKVVVWVTLATGLGVAASWWLPGSEYRP